MKTNLKLSAFLVFSVLLISLVSATPLQDFMSDDATGMTITMTQDTTANNFYIDVSEQTWDEQTVAIDLEDIHFEIEDVSLSGLLNSINLRVNLTEGATAPVFSEVVVIDDSLTQAYLNGILEILGEENLNGNLAHDTSLFNNLVAENNPSSIEMVGNAYFIKSGINYEVGYDAGFGDVSLEYKAKIGEAIIKGVNSMNIGNMIENDLLPLVDINSYLPILSDLGFEVSEVEFEDAIAVAVENLNYNVSVNLESQKFQDGTYQIPVTITPLSGDTTPIVKTVTLVLSGIINTASESADSSGVYIPEDFGVAEVIGSIQGLQPNANIIVNVQDTKPSEVSTVTNLKSLKYLIIEISNEDQPTTFAQIFFKIAKTDISNPGKVVLYRWEPTTSSWTPLATSRLTSSDTVTEYAFLANTEHFSTFMIGEDITPQSTNNGGSSNSPSGGGTNTPVIAQANTVSETEPSAPSLPIDLTNGAPITGGVIGNFLKSGWGIAGLTFAIAVALGSIGLISLNKRKFAAKK